MRTGITRILALFVLGGTAAAGGAQTLIPQPQTMKLQEGRFLLSPSSQVITNLKGEDARNILPWVNRLKDKGRKSASRSVIKIERTRGKRNLTPQEKEAYRLVIKPDSLIMSSPTAKGLFYALQTVRQLEDKGGVACTVIEDAPRYKYRGLMIDCSRHFWPVDFIKKQIDAMALLKLNTLHLHIVDGGGWRLQTDRYPQLTEKTAYRPESDWDLWTDNGRKYVSKKTPGAYGGYYTKQDIRNIIAYARRNNIEVIPEIEMPGHSNEVLAVFPELSCTGKGDGFDLCVGNPKTFEFLTGVLKEVISLFPSRYIHIGGDEATMRYWKQCPKCLGLLRRQGYRDTLQLQAHLISRIDSFLNKNGKTLLGWDEILEHTRLSPEATVMSWRGEAGVVKAAREGRHVVVSPSKYYYLDHFQGPAETEPKALGGYSPLERVYYYDPVPAQLRGTPEARFIDGVQGNLWTEYIGDEKHAEYMMYPRLLAIAESGWGTKTPYADFLARAGTLLGKMEKEGYAYRKITGKEKKDLEFTVLQWNIWLEGKLIKDGFEAIVDEIARLSPDFVTLSEVKNYNRRSFTQRLCNALREKGRVYYSFDSFDTGLLSKHPIIDSVTVFGENKDHGSIYKLTSKIDGQPVSVYTCHLDYLDCAYYQVRGYDGSTWKETERPESVEQLLKLSDLSWRDNAIQCFLNEARHDIEAGHLVVLGGDFNEPSHLDWTEATKDLYDHHGFVVPWTVSKMLEKAGFSDSYRKLYPDVVDYPGFTYPSFNPHAEMKMLTWAPKADERERIDCIYYKGNNLFAVDAKIFGPDHSVARSKAVKEQGRDPFILPQGVWPTDHKGLLVTFRLKRK